MTDSQNGDPRTTRSSVCSEAMSHTISMHGTLTGRERDIALTAARAAYRWTLREVVEELEKKLEA